MLSATTRACGTDDARRRVASMPFSSGMADIHHHHVGAQLLRQIHGLAAVGGLAHDFHIGLGVEDHLEALADHGVVVSQ